MTTRHPSTRAAASIAALTAIALAWVAAPAAAQVPVDDDGNVVGSVESAPANPQALGNDGVPLRSAADLEKLVGPVALYPDDLLAIVLPASTYPLQVVEAARFLEDLENNPELEPEEDWDDSVVALVNYPEVVELMNEDLDWTWQLGEAVVAQQSDVIAAIAAFRDQAYTAGNLKSDERQVVSRNDEDIIEIEPVSEEVIYVPYYEPERVVVYQPRPAYYYYPRAYPVYYYPYPTSYAFSWGYFWGVTTAFTIGWNSHCVNVYHPTFYGHPYYGYNYLNTWWYRRPSVVVYNNTYYDRDYAHSRYTQGDRWRPNGYTRLHYDDQRITRSRYYPNSATATSQGAQSRGLASSRNATRGNSAQSRESLATRSDAANHAAGFSGDRAQRSGLASSNDSRARIRQELAEQTRAVSSRTASNPARQQPRQQPGARTTVRDMRDALENSRIREARQNPATANTTVRRPTVPQSRPVVPQERPAVRTQRPATGTWSSAPRTTTSRPVAPSPGFRAPAPRSSSSASTSSASSGSRPRVSSNSSRSTPAPRATTRQDAAPSRQSATSERAPARSSAQRSTERRR